MEASIRFPTLRKLSLLGSLLLAVLLASFASAASPDVALKMVQQLSLGTNFTDLATRAASSTQTWRMIEAAVSPAKAKELLAKQLQLTLPKYQAEWNNNLALSYAEVLTDQEMISLTQYGRNSPYVDKLGSVGREVGAKMQARSTDLLTKATTEVISGALSASAR